MPQSTIRTARLEARNRPPRCRDSGAAPEAAKKAVTETEVIRLSRKAQEKFAALLMQPPAPAPALKRALKLHRALIVK
jgi:hypothetical protein